MKETIHPMSLKAKWKKILKGKPTSKDLKNYLNDVQRHHEPHSKINSQLA